MTNLPFLALQAKSIDDFVALVREDGYLIKSEKALLKELHRKWKKTIYLITESGLYDRTTIPDELPCLETRIEKESYRVYGVAHDENPSELYLELVGRTCQSICQSSNCAWEQYVQETLHCTQGREIPDHCAKRGGIFSSVHQHWTAGLTYGIFLPFLLLGKISKIGKSPPKNPEEEKRRELDRKRLTDAEAITFYLPPVALSPELPIHLDLELREREKIVHYSQNQLRSAYQAEFLRTWNIPELTPEKQLEEETGGCGEKIHEKNIFVGAAHAYEVIHFLENGTKNQRVVDLAHQHAELLNIDPEKFQSFCQKIKTRETAAISIASWSGLMTPYTLLLSGFIDILS